MVASIAGFVPEHPGDVVFAKSLAYMGLQPGDPLAFFPGYATRLTEVDPPHALVIEDWGAYVVAPVDDASCRLLARSRAHLDVSGVAYVLLIELPHAIMERKMLLGIKKRAEQHSTGEPDDPAGDP